MNEKLESIKVSIAQVAELARSLASTPLDTELLLLETPLRKAKLLTELSYSIQTLFFVLLKLNGRPTANQLTEIERLKSTFKNLTAATEKLHKSSLKIDKEAAERFIKHTLETAESSTSFSEKEACKNKKAKREETMVKSEVVEENMVNISADSEEPKKKKKKKSKRSSDNQAIVIADK